MAEAPQSDEDKRRERAAGFLVRLLDDAAPGACAERDRWLAADPRNAVAYAEVEAAWERAAVLRAAPPMPDHDEHPPAATPGGGDCSQQ